MNAYSTHGQLKALKDLGLTKLGNTESLVKAFINGNPGLVLGLVIGAGIGLHAMIVKEQKKQQIPYRLEGNPLYYPQHAPGALNADA